MMKVRWFLSIFLRVFVLITGMPLSFVLPYFAKMEEGKTNNGNDRGVEPRLPKWLSWYMTPDNSLWGDEGWQTQHRKDDYKTIAGMGAWIRRNPAYGVSWGLLSTTITEKTTFEVKDSGRGLKVDKGLEGKHWFSIKSNDGIFQYRVTYGWKTPFGLLNIIMDFGWLLDAYVKDPEKWKKDPKSLYCLSIRFKKM